ncbi:MAG: LysR family transcriptional regulator [Clostridiales bacterium]|nr:LysR family transcriptional regulator [Clostridiales bacterium]
MKHYNILDISIYQIDLFLAVAEEANFSDAALKMNITQPALTKRIQALESILGVPLFNRDKRPIELTEAGRYFAQQWRPLTKQFTASVNNMREFQDLSAGRLIVGLPLSWKLFPEFQRAGRQLAKEHEAVSFSWKYEAPVRWRIALAEGEIDVMIVPWMDEPSFESDWSWTHIMQMPKLVCMLQSNPLSARDSVGYEDLRTQHFVVDSPNVMPMCYKSICQDTEKHGYEPIIARYALDPSDLIGCLEHDNEVVICDRYLRNSDSEHIKCFPISDTVCGLDAVWLENNVNPYIVCYLYLLREELENTYPGMSCHDIP